MDTRIIKHDFGLKTANQPFFSWKRDLHSAEIDTLLQEGRNKQGQSDEIILSSISEVHNPLSYSAVKFNEVRLRIKHTNPSQQTKLDNYLKHFQVYLTHSSDSFYRFNSKIYRLGGNLDLSADEGTSTRLLLVHGLIDTDASEEINSAFQKLRNGELMLSPYTIWSLKLVMIRTAPKNSFTELSGYSKNVYLELVGSGSFVDEEQMTHPEKASLSVETYYQNETTFRFPINFAERSIPSL